jgi:folate-binding protein YgfZ
MAGVDTDLLAGEHRTLLEGCGLLDRSERGKLALDGPDAVEFLNGQVTNELADLRPQEGLYAAFLTHKGKMLGDLRILALAGADGSDAPELLLDTERVALQPLFDMIRRFKVGYRVTLHKRTIERGLLSLIGPDADSVLATVEVPGREHAHVGARLGEIALRAIRTDVGIDVLCDAQDTAKLEQALREGGASPVSEAAAECLRVERGRPRYGVDLDDGVIPQEAGLNERAVSFTKGCYVGQETVARLHYRGKPNRALRGLRLSAPEPTGTELTLEGRTVGRLASSVISPVHGPIALALVRREAPPGQQLAVGEEGAVATVVELPFAAAPDAA